MMGQVKAPDVPQPKRGLTDFERKIADILFTETSTNELQVERVLDVAIAIGEGLLRDARECKVQINGMSERYLVMERNPIINDNTLNEGDKVKLIIAKED
jgi:hypothetical protein